MEEVLLIEKLTLQSSCTIKYKLLKRNFCQLLFFKLSGQLSIHLFVLEVIPDSKSIPIFDNSSEEFTKKNMKNCTKKCSTDQSTQIQPHDELILDNKSENM